MKMTVCPKIVKKLLAQAWLLSLEISTLKKKRQQPSSCCLSLLRLLQQTYNKVGSSYAEGIYFSQI